MNRKDTFIRGRILFVLLFSLLVLVAWADLNYPQMSYTDWEDLAPGARFRRAQHSSPAWQLCIVEVDMNERNIDLVPVHSSPTRSTSALGAEAGAVAAVNAGFFNMSTGQALGYLEIDGDVKITTGNNWTTFGMSGNMREHLVITRVTNTGTSMTSHPHWGDVIDAIGGGPNLVTAGEVNVTSEGFGWEYERHPRTALGLNTSERLLYLVTVDGRLTTSIGMTLPELADFFLDLGCDYAMNYDGGGSTTMWADGELKNSPSGGSQRSVPTIWAVVPRYLIDWSDPEGSRTGNWQTIPYNRSYNKNSLRILGGDTSASATWTPDLARPGLYEVYVWYVSLASSAVEVPYTVSDAFGNHTIKVDQTSGGGEWQSLGMFSFEEGTGGSVTVNNVDDSDAYVVADAVYFHYRGEGLGEYIIDNLDSANVDYSGGWWTGSYGSPWDGNYHIIGTGDGSAYFRWFMTMPYSGLYEVSGWWAGGGNRETNVGFEIDHAEGTDTVYRNQQTDQAQWNSFGQYRFEQGETGAVTVTNQGASGLHVEADAVKFNLLELDEELVTSVNSSHWMLY